MALSQQSLEILLDLIEIKVSALQIQDRDDARELSKLRKCRQELIQEKTRSKHKPLGNLQINSQRKVISVG
jgi:hypothetical protein